MALTAQKQLFADRYLALNDGRKGVGAQAAREAGYAGRSAAQQASRLLKDADVIAYMESRVSPVMTTAPVIVGGKMEADEVLTRLTAIARGNIGVFLDGDSIDPFGTDKPTHLIKRIKTKRSEKFGDEIEVEMYDAQSALVTLGKHHKLFDRVAEGDWRDELLKAGVPETEVNRIFQEMVDTAARAIEHAKRG